MLDHCLTGATSHRLDPPQLAGGQPAGPSAGSPSSIMLAFG